jgi:hypothetical protein
MRPYDIYRMQHDGCTLRASAVCEGTFMNAFTDALKKTREGLEAARERGDRASVIAVAGSDLGTASYARQILQEWDRANQAALREQDLQENDRRHRQTMRVAWAAVGISIISMVIAYLAWRWPA